MRHPPINPLFHFTCDHGEMGILASGGLIKPNEFTGLIWLTDMPRANPDALGLTRDWIKCDRTQHRFTVTDVDRVIWWPEFRRALSPAARAWGETLEMAPNARPVHWYVTTEPVRGFTDVEINAPR